MGSIEGIELSVVAQTVEEARTLLASLRDRVNDLEAWRKGISAWKDATNTRLDQLKAENEEFRGRVDEHPTRRDRAGEQAHPAASR